MQDLQAHIAHLRRLEIKAKGLTRHLFSGEYHSAFKGRGMSFSEVRNYQHGDEVRTIDWNVTARYQEPFVKVFQEERELTVMFIIDVSGSLYFGSGEKSKIDLATELMATLGFSAIENKDKVGMLLVSDQIEKYIAPDKGKKHLMRMLSEFIQLKPERKLTNLNEAFKFYRNIEKKRCITFVISDFQDENAFLEGLKLLHRKHDLITLHLYDEAESKLPNLGWIEVFNAETGLKTWVDTSASHVQMEFEDKFNAQIENLSQTFKKMGLDYLPFSTNEDWVKTLIGFFKRRS